jgi:phosphoglucosamine mutase
MIISSDDGVGAVLERYRTLGAMLALGEFSVQQVASLAHVRPSTVRTVLRRENQYVEKAGSWPTGRRGGQPDRWRLRHGASEDIRVILQELQETGAGSWLGDPSTPDSQLGPLLAAEDVLLRQAPGTSDLAERSSLIELARLQVETAQGIAARPDEADRAGPHLQVTQLLLELERIEQNAPLQPGAELEEKLWRIVSDLLLAAGRTRDAWLRDAVLRRVDASLHSRIPVTLLASSFSISFTTPEYPVPVPSADALDRADQTADDVQVSKARPRLFGTDGIRGEAGRDLSAWLAVDLAIAAAHVLAPAGRGDQRPVAVVGRDTSSSGQFLEAAITAGLTSSGVDVIQVGISPAAAIAFLAAERDAPLAVSLSASHSRAPYTGIKFFGHGGYKLRDYEEDEIEREFVALAKHDPPGPPASGFGEVTDGSAELATYASHVLSSLPGDPATALAGLHVVVDCANGAATAIAPGVLRAAGARVTKIGVSPNGRNINLDCGSTDAKALIAKVEETGADAGIAFDGDADGCLAVDHNGRLISGDQILATLARDLARQQKLAHQTVVATVMSNLGFRLAMQEAGISVIETQVGDRYIVDEIRRGGYSLGGTQSGRIIVADHATGPDGLLVSLSLLATIARTGQTLSDVANDITQYPQVLVNVPVEEPPQVVAEPQLVTAVEEAREELGERGRILLRSSGTEPVVRVMVEDEDAGQAQRLAHQLANTVRASNRARRAGKGEQPG